MDSLTPLGNKELVKKEHVVFEIIEKSTSKGGEGEFTYELINESFLGTRELNCRPLPGIKIFLKRRRELAHSLVQSRVEFPW